MKAYEFLLAAGLLCTAIAAGLCQFVMIGLIGVGLFFVALCLLIGAVLVTPSAGKIPLRQQVFGLPFYSLGVLLLFTVAGYTSSLARDLAMSARLGSAPSGLQWTVLGVSSFLPALVIVIGLRNRMQWSWNRCLPWGVAVLCVSPAVLMIFMVLNLIPGFDLSN